MTNTKPCISVLLVFLILSGMIVSPVSAKDYTLTGSDNLFNVLDTKDESFDNIQQLSFDKSSEDKAITLIHFKAPMDHTVYFTIFYGMANEASGTVGSEWNTSFLPLQSTTSTITFNGETKTYSYIDTNTEFDYFLAGYARNDDNNQTGIIVYNAGYGGFDNDLAIFKPIPSISSNLIYRVDIQCDYPIDVDITYGTKSNVAAAAGSTPLESANEWVQFALGIGSSVLAFLLSLLFIIKFFFIDNLLLVIALWISVSMAYSAISAKNIFMFYKRFFGLQRSLFHFVAELWNYLIQILSSFRGIFRI